MDRIDAIYARQSIDKADSISIESQIEFCQYETRGNPYQVYSDKGYSGKNTDRPQFIEMLCAVRRGQIKRVICYKLDRCSRSILDFAKLMEEFQRLDVEFLSCTEKFDTSTPMGRAMLSICIVFAQLERETIQQRIYDAYHARSKRGFYMGGRQPFGFRLEPYTLDGKKTSRYVMIPEEANILKFIYSVYEKPDTSLTDVVIALNAAKFSNPRHENGTWSRSQIAKLLKNPIYVRSDYSVYQYFHEKGITVHSSPADFIGMNGCYLFSEGNHSSLVLAPHIGLIDSEVWLRCMRKRETGASRRHSCNTWLSGKLKCQKCGYAVVVRQSKQRNGKLYRYFICSRSAGKAASCAGIRVRPASLLENLVQDEILLQYDRFVDDVDVDSLNFDPSRLPAALNQCWSSLDHAYKREICDAFISRIELSDDTMTIHWRV